MKLLPLLVLYSGDVSAVHHAHPDPNTGKLACVACSKELTDTDYYTEECGLFLVNCTVPAWGMYDAKAELVRKVRCCNYVGEQSAQEKPPAHH